jgi:glycosyltransferase involved in cell wall biosynthesis
LNPPRTTIASGTTEDPLPSVAGRRPIAADGAPQLHLPSQDVEDPEVSIVVPALNEELTVGEFVEWCKLGFENAGVSGEILIVDSSDDRTAEIALERGARVLKTPKRGLGRAYRDAIPFIRGRFVVMGDADCTYDFRELLPFLEKYREGYEFVMGSRFRGEIEAGAMPALHRYFGSPLTTRILNVLSRTQFSDIHCGMRGVTLHALRRIALRSEGWEYASEMILRAGDLNLRTTEVPIKFYRDREGRISNVKRGGMLTPWKAGWHSLRVMFTQRADFFMFRPGLVLLAIGLIGTVGLTGGPLEIGRVRLTLHSQLLFFALVLIGLSSTYMAILTRVIYGREGDSPERWLRMFSYTRTVLACVLLTAVGVGIDVAFFVHYIQNDFRVQASDEAFSHLATTGLLMIVVGFMTFTATLVIHAAAGRWSDTARSTSPTFAAEDQARI